MGSLSKLRKALAGAPIWVNNTRKNQPGTTPAEKKMELHSASSWRKNTIEVWRGFRDFFHVMWLRASVFYSMAAPGSFFAVLMVKAVLTELTFGAAVNSRIMKF